jgi:SCY1-like protein 1
MNALWSLIGVGGGIPNFPYTLGEERTFPVPPGIPNLRLLEGVKNEDKKPVTIFHFKEESGDSSRLELLRNAAKRAKAMMLPGCLRCFDAAEYNNNFYFATEECEPLNSVLANETTRNAYYEDEEKFEHAVALGIQAVGSSLAALHKNGIVHGSVNSDAIFVLPNGGWRLFSYEMMSPVTEENPLYKRYVYTLSEFRRAPELTSATPQQGAAPQGVDAWGLGCLVYETFHAFSTSTKASDLKSGRNIPRRVQADYAALISANPKLRSSVEKFLQSSFIAEDTFVTTVQQLDELSLKDAVDRDRFYRELALASDNFPLRCCKFMLLPKLSTAIQFAGAGSATVLEPLLRIGKRLSSEEFSQLIAPAVVSLFASTDHLVRCRLLSTAESYAKYLPQQLVCDKIWPQFVTGFSSKQAEMRELTVRATVHFAPLLNEKLLTTDVVKYITLLQQDPEGPIRTNATVCLGFLGNTLPVAIRAKTLMNGFGRMLNDPFHPSRVAAVKSIVAAVDQFPPESIAKVLLPAVAPLAIDKYAEVRTIALKAIQLFTSKLEANHGTMEDAATATPSTAGTGSSANDHSAEGSSPAPKESTTPSNSSGGGGWGSWFKSSSKAPASPTPGSKDNLAPATPSGSVNALASANSSTGHLELDDEEWGTSSSSAAKPSAQPSNSSPAPTRVVTTKPTTTSSASSSMAPPRRGGSNEGSGMQLEEVRSGSPTPPPTATVAPTTASSVGGMKLGAKKKGGLGAAKIE